VVVGPKDLPKMLRTFGKTTSSLRRMAGDFRKQFDDALKEAELDDVKSTIDAARKLNPAADIRKALKPKFQKDYGTNLSFLPFIIRATVDAIAAWPWMNAEVRDNEAIIRRSVNMGMAVSIDDGKGLLVPSIKAAETLNLLGLAQAVRDFAERGRAKKLTIDDLSGGTFTITNPGVFGSLYGTPILPVGQVGILDTGAIVRRPMVIEGPGGTEAIAIRPMMYISLSYDHRLIDGADAARFLNDLAALVDGDDWGPEIDELLA
jgi:2-oxoglutarate dehydrogenase E2 component (dihydrolipoamide succinyltransferase)